MANRFKFVVEVEVSRVQGKFATREEMSAQMIEALESANPGDINGDNGREYTVDDWTVSEVEG